MSVHPNDFSQHDDGVAAGHDPLDHDPLGGGEETVLPTLQHMLRFALGRSGEQAVTEWVADNPVPAALMVMAVVLLPLALSLCCNSLLRAMPTQDEVAVDIRLVGTGLERRRKQLVADATKAARAAEKSRDQGPAVADFAMRKLREVVSLNAKAAEVGNLADRVKAVCDALRQLRGERPPPRMRPFLDDVHRCCRGGILGDLPSLDAALRRYDASYEQLGVAEYQADKEAENRDYVYLLQKWVDAAEMTHELRNLPVPPGREVSSEAELLERLRRLKGGK